MSADWGWRPVLPPPPENTLDAHLRALLARRYAHGDETALDGLRMEGAGVVAWLEGVAAGAGSLELAEQAVDLANAIRQHGTVEVIRT